MQLVLWDHKDYREFKGKLGHRVSKERLDLRVTQEILVLKVHRVLREILETQAHRDRKVSKERLDP